MSDRVARPRSSSPPAASRVNGRVAELGDKVDAVNDEIYVDGERVITDADRVYLAINKPAGVVSTMADEKGRAALADFLGNVPQRVYHVGRLDAETEGLMLLTNDGTLAHKLMHPSYGVQKTYLAEVPGPIRNGVKKQLSDGVELEDGPASVDAFRIVDSLGGRVLVETRAARGTQAHRAAAAGGGRLPGDPARPHVDRPDQDRRPEVGPHPAPDAGRDRGAVQGRRGLSADPGLTA